MRWRDENQLRRLGEIGRSGIEAFRIDGDRPHLQPRRLQHTAHAPVAGVLGPGNVTDIGEQAHGEIDRLMNAGRDDDLLGRATHRAGRAQIVGQCVPQWPITTTGRIRHQFRLRTPPVPVLQAAPDAPVQGEGGFYQAPLEFVRGLRTICDQYGILLIADEIQTGFARTGKLFAMEHYGVIPDLMTIAKSLAGGMPLSGVVGRADIMDAAQPGGLGGTYASNPLAVAAAHAVLAVIDEEKLAERADMLGQKLKTRLNGLKAVVPQLAEVRGPGSMIAAEFFDAASGEPSPEFTKQVQARALERGLLLLSCGVHGNVIRFLFPLTIPLPVFDEALDILEEALTAKTAVLAD